MWNVDNMARKMAFSITEFLQELISKLFSYMENRKNVFLFPRFRRTVNEKACAYARTITIVSFYCNKWMIRKEEV